MVNSLLIIVEFVIKSPVATESGRKHFSLKSYMFYYNDVSLRKFLILTS